MTMHQLGADQHYHLDIQHMGQPSAARFIANGAKKAMRGVEFDTIVGTGVSGAIALPVLADRLEVNWAYVRKDGDKCHSNAKIEGVIGRRWLFIDDFIGFHTRIRTIQAVHEEANRNGFVIEYAGAYYYRRSLYCAPNVEDRKTIEGAET